MVIRLDYDLYREMNEEIKQWLINENFISRMSEKTKETFKEYFINPLTVTFEQTEKQLLSIDRNKAYTSNLYDMDNIPTFPEFDNFMEYDEHELEDYTAYLVECFDIDTMEVQILTSKIFSLFL